MGTGFITDSDARPQRARVPTPTTAVQVPSGKVILVGDLTIPANATGVVLFAHGSGSSRHSPRNRFVAGVLQRAGFATLLLDLLTREEEIEDAISARFRFDIPLLAARLADATAWLANRPDAASLPIGYFGASTGAAAALVAAARTPARVAAVVSRGGRPDLADVHLALVRAPTLLIVGENDPVVIGLNKNARNRMTAPCEIVVVPGAAHLFEEQGALENVAELATGWFSRHLVHNAVG